MGRITLVATRAVLAVGVLLSLGSAGCSFRQAQLDTHGLTPMTPQNTPMTQAAAPMRPVQSLLALEGRTQTMPYSAAAWQFARLPCVNSASGETVLLDTGMDISAHVTLDIVRDNRYPIYLGHEYDVAYVPSLSLGNIADTR